ncbi:MAG TPA: xanthine phosphoribosyltransferase [Clostridiales bacterium]|nr:MAG: Xanthine phosphoribosyltransferase [Firmicutes bacterium ADurb.Bin262]HQH63926.1 xanthine phosphoribosyltransferase [Clostridiales bacterium]HQK73642.1 xanthine phosphoribosyltransferase [Clostridiales bacterium]
MEMLKKRIVEQAKVLGPDILKVDMFLNHMIDISLLKAIGEEFHRRFADEKINKILTVEASGIAVACMTAIAFGVPVVFAKKEEHSNVGGLCYTSDIYSFTRNIKTTICVSSSYLCASDRVLILDDFLANGSALTGLIDIARQAGSTLVGAGIVIEKGFQGGGNALRESGVRIESLAYIESMDDGIIVFG